MSSGFKQIPCHASLTFNQGVTGSTLEKKGGGLVRCAPFEKFAWDPNREAGSLKVLCRFGAGFCGKTSQFNDAFCREFAAFRAERGTNAQSCDGVLGLS